MKLTEITEIAVLVPFAFLPNSIRTKEINGKRAADNAVILQMFVVKS